MVFTSYKTLRDGQYVAEKQTNCIKRQCIRYKLYFKGDELALKFMQKGIN